MLSDNVNWPFQMTPRASKFQEFPEFQEISHYCLISGVDSCALPIWSEEHTSMPQRLFIIMVLFIDLKFRTEWAYFHCLKTNPLPLTHTLTLTLTLNPMFYVDLLTVGLETAQPFFHCWFLLDLKCFDVKY